MKSRNPSRILSLSQRKKENENDIANRVSKNTKLKYRSGAKKFLRYCEARNLTPIPTEENLCHFITETSREINPVSVNAYLSGILFHFSNLSLKSKTYDYQPKSSIQSEVARKLSGPR